MRRECGGNSDKMDLFDRNAGIRKQTMALAHENNKWNCRPCHTDIRKSKVTKSETRTRKFVNRSFLVASGCEWQNVISSC